MTARTLSDLREALELANVSAFGRVVREGESGQDDRAYQMRFGGHEKPPVYFDDLSRHPKVFEPTHDGRKSSAAGAFQATWTTWSEFQRETGVADFSPDSQDAFFVWCLKRRGALEAVIAGRFDEACRLCRAEWTSLPGGAEENAATRRARDTYRRWGGSFADEVEESAPSEARHPPAAEPLATEHYDSQEATMPAPLVPIAIAAAQAFLPKLIDLIPALGAAFGSGSEVQKRNVAAATMVAKAVTEAVGSPNLQTAIEAMERDPGKLAQAQEAVHELIPTLLEVGGGGIEGARKAAANPDQVPPWKNPAVIIAAAILPLVYLVAVAVLFGVGGQTWSDDIKTLFVTAIVTGALGSITGFFLGSSLGSQAKDARARQFARE